MTWLHTHAHTHRGIWLVIMAARLLKLNFRRLIKWEVMPSDYGLNVSTELKVVSRHMHVINKLYSYK